MRFFADHCVPESIATTLESKGHEVLRLRNQMAADAPDADVIERMSLKRRNRSTPYSFS